MRRRAFLSSTAALAIGVAGCSESGGSEDYDVGMSSTAFLPDSITVSAGTTVVWLNTGNRPHTVTAFDSGQPEGATFFASGGFDDEAEAVEAWHSGRPTRERGAIFEGDRFEHTFDTPGIHSYYCIPHEAGGMIGEVIVEE